MAACQLADVPERKFSSEIRVYVWNRTGCTRGCSGRDSEHETNIDHVSIDEQDSDASILTFELRVQIGSTSHVYARHPPHARL